METNVIYNEDCIGENGMCRLPDNSVDLILTDIPYLVSRETNFKSIKDYTKKEGETEYSCMNFGEWDFDFDVKKYIKECTRILKPSRSIIVWCAWQQLNLIDKLMRNFLKDKSGSSRIGKWKKTNPAVFNMDKMPISDTEYFIWNRKGSNWIFNKQCEGAEDLFFEHSCIQGGHPTEKPVSIFEYLIKTFTNEGDIVFDGCLGRGTTAESCINTNRKFIAYEKGKEWYYKSLKRIGKFNKFYYKELPKSERPAQKQLF